MIGTKGVMRRETRMEMEAKRASDSMIEHIYQVRPEHLNAAERLFGGQLMEWIDEIAGLVGMRHSNGNIITASCLLYTSDAADD